MPKVWHLNNSPSASKGSWNKILRKIAIYRNVYTYRFCGCISVARQYFVQSQKISLMNQDEEMDYAVALQKRAYTLSGLQITS